MKISFQKFIAGFRQMYTGLYMLQMGRTPLLARDQELRLAMEIDDARQSIRKNMLRIDFVLQAVLDDLSMVVGGRARADRVLVFDLKDRLAKRRAMAQLDSNLRTLFAIVDQQRDDFAIACKQSTSPRRRRNVYARFLRRRERVIRLVEELGLKFEVIERQYAAILQYDEKAQRLTTGAKLADRRNLEFNRMSVSANSNDGDTGLGDHLTASNNICQIHSAQRNELRQRLTEMMAKLKSREREVLAMRFGLQDGVSRTLSEVAKLQGVSRERVRQLEKQAIQTLLLSNESGSLLRYL